MTRLTILKQHVKFVVDAILGVLAVNFSVLLDEASELSSFDFNWLTGSIVQGNDEVKKVGFSKIVRRMLLEVSSCELCAEIRVIGQRKCFKFKMALDLEGIG